MNSELSEEIKKYPFIRITIALICGICLSLIFNIASVISLVVFITSLVCFFIFHLKNRFSQQITNGILINIVFISAGAFITSNQSENAKLGLSEISSGFLIGEVITDPKVGEKTTILKIDVLAVKNNETWISADGRTLLYVENDSKSVNLKPGDKIIFSPQLSEIENKGNPEEFDYKKYLSYNLILSSDYLQSDDWQLLKSDNKISIQHIFLRWRQGLITKLESLGLTNDELSVVSALVLGYSDGLSDEIRHAYASSGAMHILAVSGMHVGLIYGVIVFLLSFIKNKKFDIIKVILTIVLIWFYAALTGLSPSVNRAALMFTIIALGNLQKRPSGSLNAVAASAFILLIVDPLNITNLGFQLSYIAVIGIILLYKPIYDLVVVKNKFLDKVWSLTAVSVAAQLVTAPLGMFYFHQFSNYFLLTNYLLIPVSTLAIWLAIVVFASSGIVFLATFFAKILVFVIKLMNSIAVWIEKLPFSVSNDIYINLPQLLILYVAIISFSVFFLKTRNHKHLLAGLISLTLFFCFSLLQAVENSNQKYLVVYNINKSTAINIIDGRKNVMFANLDSISTNDIEFSAKNNWLKKGLEEEKYINLSSDGESILTNLASMDSSNIFFKHKFIAFGDLKVFVLDSEFSSIICEDGFQKIKVNYIVLSNSPAISLIDLMQYFEFDMIIIDSSNSNKSIENWVMQNDSLDLDLYNIKESGAFVYKI
jgi:competence protein ComEC